MEMSQTHFSLSQNKNGNQNGQMVNPNEPIQGKLWARFFISFFKANYEQEITLWGCLDPAHLHLVNVYLDTLRMCILM